MIGSALYYFPLWVWCRITGGHTWEVLYQPGFAVEWCRKCEASRRKPKEANNA